MNGCKLTKILSQYPIKIPSSPKKEQISLGYGVLCTMPLNHLEIQSRLKMNEDFFGDSYCLNISPGKYNLLGEAILCNRVENGCTTKGAHEVVILKGMCRTTANVVQTSNK